MLIPLTGLALCAAVILAAAGDVSAPVNLRTELRQPGDAPLNAPMTGVRVSWINVPSEHGSVTQDSYEISVFLASTGYLVWNSARLPSMAQQATVPGPLNASTSYSWQVRVWLSLNGSTAVPSPWSQAQLFATSPAPASWLSASWIGGFNQIRGDLLLPCAPVTAYLHASGLGAYYLFVNGARVGDHVMDPPQSVYPKRVIFNSFNVTGLVQPGPNIVGALLGNYKFGYTDVWCNMTTAGGPRGCQSLVAQLVVECSDASQHVFFSTSAGTSSNTWHGRDGPVTWDHLFHGESFDARLSLANWTQAPLQSFASNVWRPVVSMTPPTSAPGAALGPLVPATVPPIRTAQNLTAVALWPSGNGWVFDFGLNSAGQTTLTLSPGQVAPGTIISIAHAELIHPTGAINDWYCTPNPNAADIRHEPCFPHQTFGYGHETADRYVGDFNDANMTNVYIAAGLPDGEIYRPFFSAAGFRYAFVQGLPFTPTNATLTAHFVHTDVANVGTLVFPTVPGRALATPDVLNQIHAITRRAQLSNLWSIPTDCPQRERRGWLGDAQVSSNEAMMNFDMHAFYDTFLQHIRDDQLWGCASTPSAPCGNPTDAQGSLADVVPFDGIGGWPGCPVWQVAYIVITYNTFRHYGDAAMVTTHYPGMSDLMAYFQRHLNPVSLLLETPGYGDWVDFSCSGGSTITPSPAVTAFYYVTALNMMSEMASIVGQSNDAAKFQEQYGAAQKSYHQRFFNAEANGYNVVAGVAPSGSQTSNAMALLLSCQPTEAIRAQVAQTLAADVLAHNRSATGGIVGMATIFRALAATGNDQLALDILLYDAFPSVGHMVNQNATTLCENWCCTEFSSDGSSMNHIMYGAFDEYLYVSLVGIDPVGNSTTGGWRVFRAAPTASAIATLTTASATINTPLGVAGVAWTLINGGMSIELNITVPVGAMCEPALPPVLQGRALAAVVFADTAAPMPAVLSSGFHTFTAQYV